MAANNLKKLVSYLRHEFLKKRKSADPVRWGIIGLGYMAETFSTVIDGNKYGKVSAVASRSISKAQAFAAKHGHCKAEYLADERHDSLCHEELQAVEIPL